MAATKTTSPANKVIIADSIKYNATNAIATHTTPGRPEDGYTILTGDSARLVILPNFTGDSITEWEEATIVPAHTCTAIPNEVLNKLHEAFYDTNMNEEQREAFQALETYTV